MKFPEGHGAARWLQYKVPKSDEAGYRHEVHAPQFVHDDGNYRYFTPAEANETGDLLGKMKNHNRVLTSCSIRLMSCSQRSRTSRSG